MYYNEICVKHPKFKAKHEQWSRGADGRMAISAEAVNARYNHFRQVTPSTNHEYDNYNQAVESLLSTFLHPKSKVPPNPPSDSPAQAKNAGKAQPDPFNLSIDLLPNDLNDSTISEKNSNLGNSREAVHEEQKATGFKLHVDILPDLDRCDSLLGEHLDLLSSDDEERVFENGQEFFDDCRFEDASLLAAEPRLKQRRSKMCRYKESELFTPLCFANTDIRNGYWSEN